jgi:hypothetical protein
VFNFNNVTLEDSDRREITTYSSSIIRGHSYFKAWALLLADSLCEYVNKSDAQFYMVVASYQNEFKLVLRTGIFLYFLVSVGIASLHGMTMSLNVHRIYRATVSSRRYIIATSRCTALLQQMRTLKRIGRRHLNNQCPKNKTKAGFGCDVDDMRPSTQNPGGAKVHAMVTVVFTSELQDRSPAQQL